MRSKLAVILHADIAGSTRLVQLDEQLAHQRFQAAFQSASATIEKFDGATREIRGDAIVADFQRASDAVCAALEIQAENEAQNNQYSDAVHPRLRIGIAIGEVVIADRTVTGDGVILAQRIEQLAEHGGVCIQGSVFEAVPDRMPFTYANLGDQELKGFNQPIRVFAVGLEEGKELPRTSTPNKKKRPLGLVLGGIALFAVILGVVLWQFGSVGDRTDADTPGSVDAADVREKSETEAAHTNAISRSVAVLPFSNMSSDAEQQYFADGIAEDIITDLTKISGLDVIARNSSFAFRDKTMTVTQIGNELKVRYVLEGSVRRSENAVRINAQLVDVETQSHLWAERYDGSLQDVFAIQDKVTGLIVSALHVHLSKSEQRLVENTETTNFDAYDMLLRAREIQSRFTPEDNAAGRELYRQAIKLDQGYARAYAGIALTHAIDVNMNWSKDRDSSIKQGLEAVDLAKKLDPTVPQIYFSHGSLLLANGSHAEAIAIEREGVKLAPNYADGHAQLAFMLVNNGQHEEGLASLAHAKRLNPRYSLIYLYVESVGLYHMERYEEVVELLEPAIERNPAYDRTHLMIAASYAKLGRHEDAQWSLEEAAALLPNLSLADERNDSVLARAEDIERYIDGLREAGLGE